MAINVVSPVYTELLEYLAQKATPEEILAFQVSNSAQERAEALTERNKEGLLTSEEAIELEQMLEFDEWVSLLKSRALKAIQPS